MFGEFIFALCLCLGMRRSVTSLTSFEGRKFLVHQLHLSTKGYDVVGIIFFDLLLFISVLPSLLPLVATMWLAAHVVRPLVCGIKGFDDLWDLLKEIQRVN